MSCRPYIGQSQGTTLGNHNTYWHSMLSFLVFSRAMTRISCFASFFSACPWDERSVLIKLIWVSGLTLTKKHLLMYRDLCRSVCQNVCVGEHHGKQSCLELLLNLLRGIERELPGLNQIFTCMWLWSLASDFKLPLGLRSPSTKDFYDSFNFPLL